MSAPGRQHGAALMSVIFLVVVIGALGAFAIQSGISQKQTINLSLLEARADVAAIAGMEYAANRMAAGQPCPAGPLAVPNGTPGMDNLTITIACGVGVATRDITVTARFGVFGDADYVQRVQVRRTSPFAVGNWASSTQGRY